MILSESA